MQRDRTKATLIAVRLIFYGDDDNRENKIYANKINAVRPYS